MTYHRPDGTELAIRMTFRPLADGRWDPDSRAGGVRAMIGSRKYTLGRLLGKLPPYGAVVNVENGRSRRVGDTLHIRGTFAAAAVLGRSDLRGSVSGQRLIAELRSDSAGPVVATFRGSPSRHAPIRDYRALARAIREAISNNVHDPQLPNTKGWRSTLDEMERWISRAEDDLEAVLGFYSIRPHFRTSHLELIRNPR